MKILTAFLLALTVSDCYGQSSCPSPTNAELEEVIGLIILAGDNAAAPDVELIDHEIVCSAFGEQEGLLRQVSVVVEYTCTGHGNCLSGTVTEQIESQCNGGSWSNNVGGSTDDVRLESPTATLTTPGRDDCAFCLSPDKAESVELNAPVPDDVTHCVACNSSCEGLERCSGLEASDCCNYYSNSLCVDVCPTPFTPNSDNNCDCPEGTTGFNCNEVVDCGTLSNPENGQVALTGTVFGSEATYNCDSAYTLIGGGATRTCQSDGQWSSDEPTCELITIGSTCGIITAADVERVLRSYVDEHSCSNPASCPPVISIDPSDMYINCLSSGQDRGSYTHTTVTVRYERSDVNNGIEYLAQVDIGCSGLTGTWEANVLRSLSSSIAQVFSFGSGTEDGNVMTSCSACLSPSLAQDLGVTSDANYHCVGCDGVCSSTGLGLCYGPSSSDCCSYYSGPGGSSVCVDDCGPRREPDSEWECVCSGAWREPDCTMCDLSCENGGTPDLIECSDCDCLPGFSGSQCSEDIDECSLTGACVRGDCTNMLGGYSCTCHDGYTGQSCDVNIDECLEDSHNCLNGAMCVNEDPGYLCQCRNGTAGEQCEECDLPNCQKCDFGDGNAPILCILCIDGYTLGDRGFCEEVCQVDNCVKCTNSNTKCNECQTDYVATEDGLCSVKEETPSEKGGGGSTTGDEGSLGLSDFEIAAIMAGVLIFVILMIALLTCITVQLLKRSCKHKTSAEEKHQFMAKTKRARNNPAYIQSFSSDGAGNRESQLEAQMTLGAEEEETTMIDSDDGGEDGEGGHSKEDEEVGHEDNVPLSRV